MMKKRVNVNLFKIRYLITTLTFIMIFSSVSLMAKSSIVYLSELSIRGGYNFFSESSSWIKGREDILNNELFFRDENYKSNNVDTNLSSIGMGSPIIRIEYNMGIALDKISIFKNVKALKGFRGFRTGFAMSYFPFSSKKESLYEGDLLYQGSNPADDQLYTNSKITLEETMLLVGTSLNLYYYHEKGLSNHRFIPYAGIELGTTILNGKRKIILESDEITVNGKDYKIDAAIQESFFNQFTPKYGLVLGTQVMVSGVHYLDFRVGYIYQNSSVSVDRSGAWNQSVDGVSTSRRVDTASKEMNFSKQGVYITIGYTVGLQ